MTLYELGSGAIYVISKFVIPLTALIEDSPAVSSECGWLYSYLIVSWGTRWMWLMWLVNVTSYSLFFLECWGVGDEVGAFFSLVIEVIISYKTVLFLSWDSVIVLLIQLEY